MMQSAIDTIADPIGRLSLYTQQNQISNVNNLVIVHSNETQHNQTSTTDDDWFPMFRCAFVAEGDPSLSTAYCIAEKTLLAWNIICLLGLIW